MDWFRFYAEFAHDPKVQVMPEAMQRRLVMLFCLQCSNDLVTLHETDIAFALRISEAELAETKALFAAKGFIADGWKIVNWEKRQCRSDSSKERVRAYRERKKQEAGNGGCNVTETAQIRKEKIRKERINTESVETPPPSTDSAHSSAPTGGGDEHPQARIVTERFAQLRRELWPTESSLTAPMMTQTTWATTYLNQAPLEIVLATLERGMRTAAAQGKTATVSLKAFNRSMTDAAMSHRAQGQPQQGRKTTKSSAAAFDRLQAEMTARQP